MHDGIKKAVDYIKANDSYIQKAIERQTAVWNGEKNNMPALALSCNLTEEQNSWLPAYNAKETHFDGEKMFSEGLRGVLCAVNGGYGAVPSMRANMGCGIIPSLFGIQQTLFDDGKMPWMLEHVRKDNIKSAYDFSAGGGEEFNAAMLHMEYMTEKLREFSLKDIFVFPLDLQGAVDTAHLVYGDNIFYDFYDDPGFIHRLLALSCEAINFAMRECFKRMDGSGEFIAHYNHLIIPTSSGGLKVSEDTTTLLSPKLIDEFAAPYLKDILERFGGGYAHYCGKNDYLLEILLKEPLVKGINLGNPEKHDMTNIIESCRSARKVYTGGINKNPGENIFDYFMRILEPSYDKDSGRFHIIAQYNCDIGERGNIIGEFERAAEKIIKNYR